MSEPTPPRVPPALGELLATWQAWNSRDVVQQAARRADGAGDAERAERLRAVADVEAARGGAAPPAIEALAAQHELATLLGAWRWHTVTAAREQGVGWREIAVATGTTPERARTEYLADVTRAEHGARAAGLPFDTERYRAATEEPDAVDTTHPTEEVAAVTTDPAHDREHLDDPHIEQPQLEPWEEGPDAARWSAPLDTSTDATTTVDADEGPSERGVSFHPGWPVPAPTRAPAELTDRELIARAEFCEREAQLSEAPLDRGLSLVELDATWDEAERRAAGRPPDSIPAQVAGYIALVREDYDHALAAEIATWRDQLDHALPAAPTDAELVTVDPGDGFDLQRLGEITGRDGFAMFDPSAPGGVRELSPDERGRLEAAAAVSPVALVPEEEPARGDGPVGLAERSAEMVEEVERRTADPDFPYDPTAEFGDPTYREPRSNDEAAARTAHLDAHYPATGWGSPPSTEVDDALFEARLQTDFARRAHDPDPVLDAQIVRLEDLAELRPLSVEHDTIDARDEHGTLPLAWYTDDPWSESRPADAAVAEDHQRDEAPLDLGDSARPDGSTDADDGPVKDADGHWWPTREAWAVGTARPNMLDSPVPFPDDRQRLERRVDELRARLWTGSATERALSDADLEERREQLNHWRDHRDGSSDEPDLAVTDAEPGAGDDARGWSQ